MWRCGCRSTATGCGSRSSRRRPRRRHSALSLSKRPAGEPELVFAAGPGIRRIISGELTPSQAIDEEVITVVAGDATLLERFAATFAIRSLERTLQ